METDARGAFFFRRVMKRTSVHLVRKFLVVFLIIGIIMVSFLAYRYNLLPEKYYSLADFGYGEAVSRCDFDRDGIDDYHDLLIGAKKDAANKPEYDSAYYAGGYPPEDRGSCTDVIWRAFREAGYSLRDMVDKDIRDYPDDYPGVVSRDRNIDFRRVVNLQIFFEKYAVSLTTDVNNTEAWQPGDIVIFNGGTHIGIVSDKRNKKGRPYIIHNAGQPVRDEDYLKRGIVYAHFRWDNSRLSEDVAVSWN